MRLIILFVAALLLLPAAASSQIGFTLSGGAGYGNVDDSYAVENAIPIAARAGLTFWKYVSAEAVYVWVYGDGARDPGEDIPLRHLGADLLVNPFPSSVVSPYLLGGWASMELEDPSGTLTMNGFEYGGGLRVALARSSNARLDLRLDARDVIAKNDDALPLPNESRDHFFLTAGVQIDLFSSDRDEDGDGIADGKDRCPDTPPGVRVDDLGCPLDEDRDGVADGLDACPGTPLHARIDPFGCPVDGDKDGVPDGLDLCIDTPGGTLVDSSGCPLDSDQDGVSDGKDRCPGTPPGARVDAGGCPFDFDGDGVADGRDLCPDTATGVRVDDFGCPEVVGAVEKDLVDDGVLSMRSIHFEYGKARTLPSSHDALDSVADVLLRWPTLRVEISGHTDSAGSEAFNRTLSRERAVAVREWLIRRYAEIGADRLTAIGFGESRPVTSNATEEGRALNRRVEFRVLNPEALR